MYHIYLKPVQIWEAKQKKAQEEQHHAELRQRAVKEQELYHYQEVLGTAHPLAFVYEPPPGYVPEEACSSLSLTKPMLGDRTRRWKLHEQCMVWAPPKLHMSEGK